jgi:hypothetical protein
MFNVEEAGEKEKRNMRSPNHIVLAGRTAAGEARK